MSNKELFEEYQKATKEFIAYVEYLKSEGIQTDDKLIMLALLASRAANDLLLDENFRILELRLKLSAKES